MPEAIKQIRASVFLLGALWAFVAAALPMCGVIGLWLTGMAAKPDWMTLWHSAAFHGGLGVVAFWRKNKALLQLPPMLAEVKSLVTTSAQMTEQAGQPAKLVTTVTEVHAETRAEPVKEKTDASA